MIGFTGTRKGMTPQQCTAVWSLLQELDGHTFHHGMCAGADAEASRFAKSLGYLVVGHPGHGADGVAAYDGYADQTMPSAPYLVRNHYIVDNTTILIATPGEETERPRTGTWATIRYARKLGREVYLLLPSGVREREVTIK